MFKHLRGPTCPSRSAQAAGFPLFLFLLTLRNFTVSELPVLFSHAPHLITDTCLSRNRKKDRGSERERENFPGIWALPVSCHPLCELHSFNITDALKSFYNPHLKKVGTLHKKKWFEAGVTGHESFLRLHLIAAVQLRRFKLKLMNFYHFDASVCCTKVGTCDCCNAFAPYRA